MEKTSRKYVLLALLGATVTVAALILGALVWVDRIASSPDFKLRIEEAASRFLSRPLTIESLEWRRGTAPTLIATQVRLWEDAEKSILLVDSPLVETRMTLLSLFELTAGISEMKFVKPRIFLRRDGEKKWNIALLIQDIRKRPRAERRRWGALVFNRFVVEGGRLSVEDAAQTEERRLAFLVDGHGKLKFGISPHFPFELTGRVDPSSATIRLNGELGAVTVLRGELRNGDASLASFVTPPARSWRGQWNGSFVYQNKPGQWRFETSVAPLVLSTALPEMERLEAKGFYLPHSTSTNSPALQVDLSARDVRFRSHSLGHIQALLTRTTGPYQFDRVEIQGLGGTITAQGLYWHSRSTDSFTISWKTTGVRAENLVKIAGGKTEMGGIADTEGYAQSGLGAHFLPHLNGRMTLHLRDGWFGAMPGLIKIFSRLNIRSLVMEAKGGTPSHVPFDETHGVINIKDGKASTEEPFVVRNRTLQMAFMGSLDLPGKRIDGRLAIHFLTLADEILRQIPGVRAIFLGEDKSLTPVWVEVKGTAADPDIRVLSGKSIASPVWNTLRRVFRLPEKLINEISGK